MRCSMCLVSAANESTKAPVFSISAELDVAMNSGLIWMMRAARASIAARARSRDSEDRPSGPTAMCVGSSPAIWSSVAAIASTVSSISGRSIARISAGAS
jgi:hypothetical protein